MSTYTAVVVSFAGRRIRSTALKEFPQFLDHQKEVEQAKHNFSCTSTVYNTKINFTRNKTKNMFTF